MIRRIPPRIATASSVRSTIRSAVMEQNGQARGSGAFIAVDWSRAAAGGWRGPHSTYSRTTLTAGGQLPAADCAPTVELRNSDRL